MSEDKDPLGIRTKNPPTPAEPVTSLRRRDLGNAFWLLLLLRSAGVPDDWNEREPILVCRGADIPDAELAARLDISVRTLATWRRRLKKLRLLASIRGPSGSCSYALEPLDHLWFGVLNGKVPPDEQQRIVGRAPASIQ